MPKEAAKVPDLYIGEGECLHLSPESKTYGPAYRQIQPKSIDEVREILGSSAKPSDLPANCCNRAPELMSNFVSLADLESEDRSLKTRSRDLVHMAAKEYVQGDPSQLTHWKSAIDRYLELTKVAINAVYFGDIEVANGATLTISKTTHVIYANKVRLHGSGTIVCNGPLTLRVESFEGNIGLAIFGSTVSQVFRQP